MAGALTINTAALQQRIMLGAISGARRGAQGAERRIKDRAPVRKLFRGTTYRSRNVGGESFRQPIKRMVRFQSVDDVRSGERGTAIVGHANSLRPLFRRKVGDTTYFITGDFRQVEPTSRRRRHPEDVVPSSLGRLGKLEGKDIDLYTKKGGKVSHEHPTKSISGEELTRGKDSLLTSRGRYEVRSGRADFRAPGSNITRVGGRLQGEIHIEGPQDDGRVVWFHIVSATKDPTTGRLYPRDQEFGNRHTRPHPFMRPGLRESKSAFTQAVRTGINRQMKGEQ